MKFPKKEMLRLIDADWDEEEEEEDIDISKYKLIENEVYDTRRWSVDYRIVFTYEDKLYIAYYSVGATEQQEESPWEYDEEVEAYPAESYTKTSYRRIGA